MHVWNPLRYRQEPGSGNTRKIFVWRLGGEVECGGAQSVEELSVLSRVGREESVVLIVGQLCQEGFVQSGSK